MLISLVKSKFSNKNTFPKLTDVALGMRKIASKMKSTGIMQYANCTIQNSLGLIKSMY